MRAPFKGLGKFTVFVLGFSLGVFACWFVAKHLIQSRSPLAKSLRLVAAPSYEDDGLSGPPAMDPNSLPDTVTAEDIEQGRVGDLPDAELDRIVHLLPKWRPKRHQDEYGFHRSFDRFLLENGYSEDQVELEPRVSWTAGDEGAPRTRHAQPDFVVRGRVLIEIKRNLTGSSESDRSLGQMLRYLVAWRSRGPALLLVCNEYDDNLRRLIGRHVKSWKAQGVPILAYFVRAPEKQFE